MCICDSVRCCVGYAITALAVSTASAQEQSALIQDTNVTAVLEPGTNYVLGQSMLLTLRLSNKRDTSIRLAESISWDSDFPIAKLDIQDPAGNHVLRRQAGYETYDRFNASAKVSEVPPHGERQWQIDITHKYALTNAGIHSVSALVSIPPQGGSGEAIAIRTPEAKFRIAPPPSAPRERPR